MPHTNEELKAKLNSKRYVRERWVEPVGTMDEPCDADDDGAEAILRNPDGPEAADLIQSLEEQVEAQQAGILQAVLWFEEYVSLHMAKSPPDMEKAASNQNKAAHLKALLTPTQEVKMDE